MNSITILFLAFGLAMDAFAVSISCGISDTKVSLKNALKIGVSFGIFQAGMTATGWILGMSFKQYIESIDHLIALILLVFIGVKMIKESRNEDCDSIILTDFKMLMTLSIATSIDAMAAGLSLTSININILLVAIEIGVITFILSFFGVLAGKKIGDKAIFKSSIDILGGIILICIGLKIFIEHVLF